MKQPYRVKQDDVDFLGGTRVAEDRSIELTQEEAEAWLARDIVEPLAPQAGGRAKSKGQD